MNVLFNSKYELLSSLKIMNEIKNVITRKKLF